MNVQYLIAHPIILLQYLVIYLQYRGITQTKRNMILRSQDASATDKLRMLTETSRSMREITLFIIFITQLLVLETTFHLIDHFLLHKEGIDQNLKWRGMYIYFLLRCGSATLMLVGISRSISMVVDRQLGGGENGNDEEDVEADVSYDDDKSIRILKKIAEVEIGMEAGNAKDYVLVKKGTGSSSSTSQPSQTPIKHTLEELLNQEMLKGFHTSQGRDTGGDQSYDNKKRLMCVFSTDQSAMTHNFD
ncbi:hypothetical protein FGO68_gene7795 [Halteria grandinella]|uniref:Uncharacterized protein n=1 Tax=Halteria grandinella TaxID=5974 RepID=A0A8J8NRD4_HALGN|nr:hypothetical protein FGO68_gene7795 [Halteria grandinella]